MTSVLHCDVETRSTVELKKTGAFVYFDDPTTDIWCAAYAFDDEPVELWVRGELCPDRIREHVEAGGRIVAHNAAFERLAFAKVLGPRYGWPVPKVTQWYCTMARALALALPGSLEDACTVTQTDVRKDLEGARVMKQMAKPRRPRKGEDASVIRWWNDAERLKKLYAYCKNDVESERALEKKLLPLSDREQVVWWLDQKINDRGVAVDVELCHAALAIVEEKKERLDREMREVTGGEVAGTSAVAQIKAYLRDQCGFDVGDSLAKGVLADFLIRDDLDAQVRRVLELRQEGSRTSVSKIDALLNGMQADYRSRGLLQYHAASTGRWSGRRFQPQNIKRPELKNVDGAITIVRTGDIDLVEAVYGDSLSAIGDCLRGMVRADPGNRLVVADYSNIEGRVLAWLAGEAWKIEAFKAADEGTGPEIYLLTASEITGIPLEKLSKKSPERQPFGKVPELSMGYEGGVGAFLQMAPTYGVKIEDYYDTAMASSSGDVLDMVNAGWGSRGLGSGINERAWRTAESIKVRWRNKHPATRQFWKDMEAAAVSAIREKGKSFRVGRLRFFCKASFLFMELPSGRRIAYAFPKLEKTKMPWSDKDGNPVFKEQVRYKGVDSVTHKWCEQATYGGKLTENACQAVARDLLAEALPRLELAGYPTVLTVHDEAMAEVAEDFGSVEEYERLLAEAPEWADGLPLVAEGFEAERYRK